MEGCRESGEEEVAEAVGGQAVLKPGGEATEKMRRGGVKLEGRGRQQKKDRGGGGGNKTRENGAGKQGQSRGKWAHGQTAASVDSLCLVNC